MRWLTLVVVWLVLSLLIPFAIGATLHGTLGALLGVFLTQGFFWITVVFVSQYLFATPSSTHHTMAFRVFLAWLFNAGGFSYVAKEGKVEKRMDSGFIGMGPGVLLVDTNTAVLFERYGRLSRICGPGVWFVGWDETARGAADLRPQIRRLAPIKALSRDGIWMDTRVQIMFQHKPLPQPEDGKFPKEPFGYDGETVHWAIYNPAIGQGQATDWGEPLVSLAADKARNILMRYTLDDLFRPENPQVVGFSQIRAQFREEFKQGMQELKIPLHYDIVSFGLPIPPAGVTEQRVRSWRTAWAGKTIEIQALGQAEALSYLERARAVAQREVVKAILDAFESLDGPIPKELIRLRLVTALERMLADPGTRELVPYDAMQSLQRFLEPPTPPRKPPQPTPVPGLLMPDKGGKP